MSLRPVTKPVLGGLVVATMFRGDRRQLIEWCNFHLSAGADRLYVALDRPATELVDALPEEPRVHWEVIDNAMWDRSYAANRGNVERKQVDAIRWLAQRARGEGHEYLAFVDTDELLDLAVPFGELVAGHREASALTLPVREMWYADRAHMTEPFGATLALGQAPRGFDWKRTFGWRAQYFRNGMLGHHLGKTIYKLPLGSGQLSVHGPLTGSLLGRAVALPDETARVLHFDCGTFATWNAKWGGRITGNVVAGGLGPHRRAQLRLFEHVLRRAPEEQKRFFERFYTIDPEAVGELEVTGMAQRIEVGPFLDGPMPVPTTAPNDALTQLPSTTERTDFQFAMVCDRNFVKPTFATMISVLSQIDPDKSVRFVVLGDGLRAADVHHLRSVEHTPFRVEVLVPDITRDLNRDLGAAATGVSRSRATYGRAYLVDLLPEQRTIYLDGDVLATRDVTELFDVDLGDACIAGVPDSAAFRLVANPEGVPLDQRMRLTGIAGKDPLEYLNAGVLVLNLDHPDFHELALLARAYVTMEGRALAQHDQDAINLAFAGRKYRLPATYNYMTQFYTSDRCLDGELVSAKYAAADASLIHFSGRVKPWLTSQNEFYNGLYRRLVLDAEERLGVSCGFYFSRPQPGPRQWTAQRWKENLEHLPAPAGLVIPAGAVDVELVDFTDSAVYLRLASDAYEHACAAGLRLVARTSGQELFQLPIDRFSAQQAHLSSRVMPGVRTAPLDLISVLAPYGGLARHVELFLTPADAAGGFERSLGMVDVLAAGKAATPALLPDVGVDGSVDDFAKGLLTGWYRSPGVEPVSLHIGGELVARRMPPVRGDDGTRAIRFRVAQFVGLGYGAGGGDISVRVARTNVPLPGLSLDVAAVRSPTVKLRESGARLADTVRRRLAGAQHRLPPRVQRQVIRLRARARRRP